MALTQARSASKDPITAFRFTVHIPRIAESTEAVGGFKAISGLEAFNEVIEYREGGQSAHARKYAGLTNYNPITLIRGVTNNMAFYDWMKEVHNHAAKFGPGMGESDYRRNMFCKQWRRDGNSSRIIWIYECFPSRYRPTDDLEGLRNEVATEELELANEGFEVTAA